MNVTQTEIQERETHLTTMKEAADKAWADMIADLKAKYPPDGARPKCDHEWNNEGCNPTHCLKCGMSIMAYAMMECP